MSMLVVYLIWLAREILCRAVQFLSFWIRYSNGLAAQAQVRCHGQRIATPTTSSRSNSHSRTHTAPTSTHSRPRRTSVILSGCQTAASSRLLPRISAVEGEFPGFDSLAAAASSCSFLIISSSSSAIAVVYFLFFKHTIVTPWISDLVLCFRDRDLGN